MKQYIFFSCLSAWFVMVYASEAPDNFFLSFDKDLHTFGVLKNRRWWNQSKDEGKTTAVEANSKLVSKKNEATVDKLKSKTAITQKNGFIDDYEVATKRIFDAIENAEKVALTATKALIHGDVDTFFGKHGHQVATENADTQILERSRKKALPKKSTQQIKEEPKLSRVGKFMSEYFDSSGE